MSAKVCLACQERLSRRVGEQMRDWRNREWCDRECAARVVVGTCYGCGGILKGAGVARWRSRKFCNLRCSNAYDGPRDRYLKEATVSEYVWPYGPAIDPLVARVNEAVPRSLPEQIRAEACQELSVALLEATPTDFAGLVQECVARARRGYQFSSRHLSLDLPMPGSPSLIPLKEQIADPSGAYRGGGAKP